MASKVLGSPGEHSSTFSAWVPCHQVCSNKSICMISVGVMEHFGVASCCSCTTYTLCTLLLTISSSTCMIACYCHAIVIIKCVHNGFGSVTWCSHACCLHVTRLRQYICECAAKLQGFSGILKSTACHDYIGAGCDGVWGPSAPGVVLLCWQTHQALVMSSVPKHHIARLYS